MTKHVDHATQIRLLGPMGVEARLGRAETAPETGKVDEQVCSIESASEEENECEYEKSDCEEELIDWAHEFMVDWVDDGYHRPFRGRRQSNSMHGEQMSPHNIVNIFSCQTEITENGEMSHEEIDNTQL